MKKLMLTLVVAFGLTIAAKAQSTGNNVVVAGNATQVVNSDSNTTSDSDDQSIKAESKKNEKSCCSKDKAAEGKSCCSDHKKSDAHCKDKKADEKPENSEGHDDHK